MLSIILALTMSSGVKVDIVNDCKDLGKVTYPVTDSILIRHMHICTRYGINQTNQIIEHELVHLCMHNHLHIFKDSEQLAKHLNNTTYPEEQIAIILAPCLIENELKIKKVINGFSFSKYGRSN